MSPESLVKRGISVVALLVFAAGCFFVTFINKSEPIDSVAVGAQGHLADCVADDLPYLGRMERLRIVSSMKATILLDRKVDPKNEGYDRAYSYRDAKVWSFLQGPLSWSRGYPWSGEWAGYILHGRTFGGFGCGFCCMANIYSTLSGRPASPLDLVDFAQEAVGYAEDGKAGAIGWGGLKYTLRAAGISCDVYHKPDKYSDFKKDIAKTGTAIILVSSNADDTFWHDTPGHYVNIWNYNPKDGTVMLCEPGDPWNNRSRIPLIYIYKALKLTSKYQYLLVDGYDEGSDELLSEGIDDNWVKP